MTTVNHECYVSLEVAKLLKKAGFDWQDYFVAHSIDGQFHWEIPLHIAQRWLREVKGIHICVKANEASANCKYFVTVIVSDTKWGNIQDDNRKTIMFDTYEEAQEAGIKKALELILEKGE